ncbi:hypothetical protein Droror1_Dr00023552 [Drosera rotundifolia]
MSQTVVLKVGMSCQGCAGAVNRVLEKMEGVESYDIDLKEQKVTVTGSVQPDTVLQNVSKSGKKTSFWEEAAPTVTAVEAEVPPPAVAEAQTPVVAAGEAHDRVMAAGEAPAPVVAAS